VGKSEGKRALGRRRLRLECNIKMDLTEIRWGSVKLSHLAQDKDEWHTLVDAITKYGIHRMLGTCRPTKLAKNHFAPLSE
jgi:hypothetical protein